MRSIVIVTIEDYIIKGQYPKTFEYMKETSKELLKDQDLYDDILKLQSRFNKLSQQKLANTIAPNLFSIELSKIGEAIIEYKNRIEKSLHEKEINSGSRNPQIELLIYTNAYAFTIQDLQMIEKTLHAEIKEEQLHYFQHLFSHNQIELIYDIKSIEIIEMTEEFATATVVQLTTKKNQADLFRNNEIKIDHTFAKENGRWKIFSSLTQEIKYF